MRLLKLPICYQYFCLTNPPLPEVIHLYFTYLYSKGLVIDVYINVELMAIIGAAAQNTRAVVPWRDLLANSEEYTTEEYLPSGLLTA